MLNIEISFYCVIIVYTARYIYFRSYSCALCEKDLFDSILHTASWLTRYFILP